MIATRRGLCCPPVCSLVATTVLLLLLGSSSLASAPKPNVILILADDLGWRDRFPYGSRFHETPNLERLAQRGMRFTNAYAANPLCSPTRASILTGLYPARLGITTPSGHLPEERLEAVLSAKGPPDHKALQVVSATRLKTTYPTLVKSLKHAGYVTGHFGKWQPSLSAQRSPQAAQGQTRRSTSETRWLVGACAATHVGQPFLSAIQLLLGINDAARFFRGLRVASIVRGSEVPNGWGASRPWTQPAETSCVPSRALAARR